MNAMTSEYLQIMASNNYHIICKNAGSGKRDVIALSGDGGLAVGLEVAGFESKRIELPSHVFDQLLEARLVESDDDTTNGDMIFRLTAAGERLGSE